MAETRKQLKERLQAAGVWPDYVTLRQQLSKDGMTPTQARKEALHQVESRPRADAERLKPDDDAPNYPIGKQEQAPAEQSGFDFGGKTVPSGEAVEWVAENIANPTARPGHAPSGLAWGLLTWVRRTPANEATFWSSIFAKSLSTSAAAKSKQEKPDETDEKPDRGSENALALCRSILKKMAEDARNS
jgi:hypothetical protein